MSFLIRLVLGAVFMIGGLFSYYGQTDLNPVTGEKQRIQISPRQEIVLGLQSRQKMAAQYGGLDPNESLQAYVNNVGDRVVKNSTAQQSPYPFEFHLLRDPKNINAFALPGGQVFITAALLGRLDSEAQLAAVLGHEIGHVVGRHGAEHLAKQNLGSSLVNAVGIVSSGGNDGGQGAAVMAGAVNHLVNLRYGRKDESESDRLGLQFMTQAAYSPIGILQVMKILAAAGGRGRQPEFFKSHPDPGNRFETLNTLIAKTYPNGVPTTLDEGRDRFAQYAGSRS